LHIDLQRIVEDEKIRMQIPIHFLGEEEAVGVKIGGGSVSRLMTEIEVSCFPKDLPEFLEVDISELELDQMLYVSNISLPKGVEVSEILLEQDQAIVSIHEIKEIIDEEGDADGESTDDQAAAESSGEESSDDSSDTSDSDKSEG
jgi:large subunit ribosomal protein L25